MTDDKRPMTTEELDAIRATALAGEYAFPERVLRLVAEVERLCGVANFAAASAVRWKTLARDQRKRYRMLEKMHRAEVERLTSECEESNIEDRATGEYDQ